MEMTINQQHTSIKDLIVENVDVWAAAIEDQPGALATTLGSIRKAGADLEFIIARRSPETPGKGVVFITPLRGDAEIRAASQLGFNVTNSLHSIRIEGQNQPGIASQITELLAHEGINLKGLSVVVIGTRFIIYLALDTQYDAAKAIQAITQI